MTAFVDLDLAFWPDRSAIEFALNRPRDFATYVQAYSGRVDSLFADLAERCAKASSAQDLLQTLERDLGARHSFYVEVSQAFWDADERQRAPMGSRKGMNDPRDDAFLQSFEWRRVRMMVLERDGGKCACCGATAADDVQINVDHIKPRKRYPALALDPANLQVLCSVCNHGKGNRFSTDWRAHA